MRKFNKKTFIGVTANIVICFVIAILAITGTGNSIYASSKDYKAYYKGNGDGVSLMINVYEHPENVEKMIEILDEYNATATFFIGGIWAEKNMETLKKVSLKHEIGNHGYLHRDHKKMDYDRNYEEITITSNLLKNITGKEINLFAPPSGSYGNNMLKVCEDLNYSVIMWSKDTIDWRDHDTQLIVTRATKEITNGDLILMHPTCNTVQALPKILEYYKQNNIKTISVSQNIKGVNI